MSGSIVTKCLRTLSGLFSPNLIDQSSYRILTTHAKTRPIMHDEYSIRMGENRLNGALNLDLMNNRTYEISRNLY